VIQTVARDRAALGISQARLVSLSGLPELWTSVVIQRPHSFVTLERPTEAMGAVIAAARSVLFEEQP
jgi:hypothetical protein